MHTFAIIASTETFDFTCEYKLQYQSVTDADTCVYVRVTYVHYLS